jgi:hypothetical protein
MVVAAFKMYLRISGLANEYYKRRYKRWMFGTQENE